MTTIKRCLCTLYFMVSWMRPRSWTPADLKLIVRFCQRCSVIDYEVILGLLWIRSPISLVGVLASTGEVVALTVSSYSGGG
jgi:hypothetical protein